MDMPFCDLLPVSLMRFHQLHSVTYTMTPFNNPVLDLVARVLKRLLSDFTVAADASKAVQKYKSASSHSVLSKDDAK